LFLKKTRRFPYSILIQILPLGMEENQAELPQLDPEEQRVLGALMEKSRTTPEYYPMTINALTAACNQKTSRDPVVQYDEQTVTLTIGRLKKKGLVSTATGGASRSIKYKHNFALVFQLPPAEMAIMCLLLLRGPQTPGALHNRSVRLWEFGSIEEVQVTLDALSGGPFPFVRSLPRQPGQKEIRYVHLLGLPAAGEELEAVPLGPGAENELEKRLAAVEAELANLKEAYDHLMKELMG
jgi:uncharacterized protein YceH (UPF0502 family)